MYKTVVDVFRAFFDFKDEEQVEAIEVAKKASFLTIGRIAYGVSDYAIAAILGVMVVWMNANGFSSLNIFFATWLYDFAAGSGYFFISDMTGCDITLAQSFRRVADSFARTGIIGKIFAGLFLFGLSIKAIVWEGPEVICFLFKKELRTRQNIWIAMFILSAIQGAFGSWLYTTGYELWEKFGSANSANSHYVFLGVAIFVCFIILASLTKKMIRWSIKGIRFIIGLSRKKRR